MKRIVKQEEMKKNDRRNVTKEYFDSQAECYDKSHDGRFVKCMYEEIVNRALALPGEKLLDLGCGNGNILGMLIKKREGDYFGADLSPKMIREARRKLGQNIDLRVADATNLPYGPGLFDVIICNASFHHYTEPDKAIDEMKRVLKSGGVLILGDPTIPGKWLRALLNARLRNGGSGDYHIYGKKEILSLFQRHGFLVDQWKSVNYKTFLFHAKKE